MEFTRRNLLKAAAMLLMDGLASSRARALGINRLPDAPKDGPKVIVRTCGGIRAAETFHEDGFRNIPHLYGDLLPHTVFYPVVRNSGVISHYNTISCILIGNRQRVNDWGKTPPVSPTIFEYLRKRLQTPSDDAWLISSNTALTSQIAASSDRAYGPRYGANVVFPKQLLIDAVLSAATHGRVTQTTDRTAMQSELREHSPDRPAESSDILLQRILGSWRHTLITPRQINEYWPTFGE